MIYTWLSITEIKNTWKHYLVVYFNDVFKSKLE